LRIFRRRKMVAADITILLAAAAVFSTFYFVSLYVQQILGYRPLDAGAAFLVFSAGIATGATVARELIRRLGVRILPVIGLALATAGMIVLTQLPVHGSYISDVFPGLLPIGVGMGLTFVPLTLTATSESGSDDAGLISGLLNTAQQIGGSVGLAALATLAAGRTTRLLRPSAAHRSIAAAQVSGFHLAFTAAAILLGAAWLIVAAQLRTRRARQPQPRYEVPSSVAAEAIGCAQCAPVAIGARRTEPQPAGT
jgi:predicted MFS family arabinose efflux permease